MYKTNHPHESSLPIKINEEDTSRKITKPDSPESAGDAMTLVMSAIIKITAALNSAFLFLKIFNITTSVVKLVLLIYAVNAA